MSLRVALTANTLGTGVVALVGFAVTLLLVRALTPPEFAKLSLCLLLFNATSVFDIIRPSALRSFAGAPDSDVASLLRLAVHANLFIGVGFAVVIYFASRALGNLTLGYHEIALLAISGLAYFVSTAYSTLLDAKDRVLFTSTSRNLGWIVTYLLFALLAASNASQVAYLAALCAMNLALLVTYRQAVLGILPSTAESKVASFSIMRADSTNMLAFNLAGLVTVLIDRFALSNARGAYELGVYSGFADILSKPAALFRAVNQIMYPRFVKLRAEGREFASLWLTTAVILILGVIGTVVVLLLNRNDVISYVFGNRYVEYADSAGFLAMALCAVCAGYQAIPALNAIGNFRLQKNFYLLSALVMIVCSFPIAARFGATGIATLFLVCRLSDVALLGCAIYRVTGRALLAPFAFVTLTISAALVAAQMMMVGIAVASYVLAVCVVVVAWRRMR